MTARLERGLSGSGHLLLFRRTRDWFPHPPWQLTTICISSPRALIPFSAFQQHQDHVWYIHIYIHTGKTFMYMQKNQQAPVKQNKESLSWSFWSGRSTALQFWKGSKGFVKYIIQVVWLLKIPLISSSVCLFIWHYYCDYNWNSMGHPSPFTVPL